MSKKPTEEKSTSKRVVDQITIAKRIVEENPQFNMADVQKIIQREQELTMFAVAKGYKVVKKNYLTVYPVLTKERKLKSPLNGTEYTLPAHTSVGVRVGEGFKTLVANRKMPSKICRSVAKTEA